MFLHQSNRLELLLHQLRAVLRDPLPDPLAPEIIVVHNPGMAQWLAQQLAFADGIAAHCHFPLPARFAWDLVRRFGDVLPEEDEFRKPVLRWRIAALLPTLLDRPAFREPAAYLRDDADGGKLDQLSARIADLFDQYIVYRPDLLAGWQLGRDDHWQALLWRGLTASAVAHRARLAEQFRVLLAARPNAGLLPPRCHLFGLNSLAPVHLEIIARIDSMTEVHLFHLSPCRHYWGDLVSARRLAGERDRNRRAGAIDAYVDQGHSLLASLGKIGQDFFRQLLEGELQEIDLYRESEAAHALAALQNDILDLNDRSAAGAERHVLADDDRSLQFHCCSSPLREVQVLHDRLLDLFRRVPDLTPGDILVGAPDIQGYVEAIAGVFGEAGGERRIPWSLADQPLAGEHALIRCLLDLLDLLPGRFTAPEVLSLCETPALLRRFGLDPAILPRLHDWVRETGIRWGLDTQHREELEIHAGDLHSWRFGLDRLLLGYVMGDCQHPQAGRLPYGHLAGGESEALGGFLALIDTLAHWRLRLRQDRPMNDWCSALQALIDELFAVEEEDQGLRLLRETVNGLRADCRLAGHTAAVSFAVLRRHLHAVLDQPAGGQPFLSGRVTFCNMVPMRSVPFRVVCLLGMNDQAFPRRQHPLAFDLMAAHPRLGDRNRSQDDRYLFLEALLSAREVFYLSWTGRNQRDDAIAPPSAVVAELRDYLDQSCLPPSTATAVADQLTTVHPIQPFSRRCFDGTPATAGYNPAWLPAERDTPAPPFLARPLPPPADDWRTVDVDELARFWSHPARFFLERMLGLRLRNKALDMDENEPFALDRLDQYHLRRATVAGLLEGMSTDRIYLGLETGGLLPRNGFGRVEFAAIAADSIDFADRLRPLIAQPLEPVAVDLALGPFRLVGWLGDCHASGRVTWRTAAPKGTDLIVLLVRHLVLNLQAPEGLLPVSVHLARDPARPEEPVRCLTLPAMADAENHLRLLLDGYWQGLSAPLPFFPETSLAWAKTRYRGKDAHAAARQVWEVGFYRDGEGSDPVYRLCFPWERFAATPEFIDLAELYNPILPYLEDDDAAA
ncbi:MAG: exodeoxyribonuclease V subunit gamma [Desulfobulbus sp.]|uniref:exodeoxyribonuclease V subunit gamma n=1 Tax=Desulfobulbus sp. TaxID=895 RepID=UPI00283D2F7E|nr:exodeoxyribonuclease V subunit gamma [Desulfobulbus sp.]MDR2551181.1 exodeoxyribonuclease V subunit gamma [Desulfobulbus sp.]